MTNANDDWVHLSAKELEIIRELDEKIDDVALRVGKLLEERTASLELAAALEDIGNQLLEFSEEVSASYSRRSRLRAVE